MNMKLPQGSSYMVSLASGKAVDGAEKLSFCQRLFLNYFILLSRDIASQTGCAGSI